MKNLSPAFASWRGCRTSHLLRGVRERRTSDALRRRPAKLYDAADASGHPCAHIHCVEVSELPHTTQKRGATLVTTRANVTSHRRYRSPAIERPRAPAARDDKPAARQRLARGQGRRAAWKLPRSVGEYQEAQNALIDDLLDIEDAPSNPWDAAPDGEQGTRPPRHARPS